MATTTQSGFVTRVSDKDVAHCSIPQRAQFIANVRFGGLGVSCKTHNNTVHLIPCVGCCPHVAPITAGSSRVRATGLGIGRVGDAITVCTAVAEGIDSVHDGSSEGS